MQHARPFNDEGAPPRREEAPFSSTRASAQEAGCGGGSDFSLGALPAAPYRSSFR